MNDKLAAALADLEKRFGKGSVMRLGEEDVEPIEVISTGVPSLDLALGVKGFPRGRIIEIYGQESVGKSSLAFQVIANAQKQGLVCAYLDLEHSGDPGYMAKLGIDTKNLLVSQPSCSEDAFEIAEALVRSGEIGVIVLDSVAALVPQAEIQGEAGDAQMGLVARQMSQAMRKLTAPIAENNVCFIFINQLRSKIGVVWGSPTTTTGGNALKFYATMRLEVTRLGQIKDGEQIIGNLTKIKAVKNKLSPPFREVEVEMIFGEGISKEADIIKSGLETGIISKGGAWYSYGETRLGQGKENVRKLLKDNPELAKELEQKILSIDSK